MITEEFNPIKASNAQEEYCRRNNAPHFAPNANIDYRCYHCGRNIYGRGGWSVEYAAKHLVTGCPFCHYSFVE